MASTAPPSTSPAPPIPKSWKRKYRKLHRTFTQLSQRSDQLFVHSTKLSSLLVRLSEQNEDLTMLIRRTGMGLIDDDVFESLSKKAREVNGNGVNGTGAGHDSESELESAEDAEEIALENEEFDNLGKEREELEVPEEMEEERNPMGVYEWLRRNQPQVFLQDIEGKKKRAEEEGELTFVGEKKKKSKGTGEGAGGKRKRAITMEGVERKKPGPKRRKKSPGA